MECAIRALTHVQRYQLNDLMSKKLELRASARASTARTEEDEKSTAWLRVGCCETVLPNLT
jgi:hypothetical protein